MDDDSDRWVVVEMGMTQLFDQLRQTLSWNSLMVCNISLFFLFFFHIVHIEDYNFNE